MTAVQEPLVISDTEYAKLLEAIHELHRRRPTLRLGQIICSMATVAGANPSGVYDLEDHDLLAALRKQLLHDQM